MSWEANLITPSRLGLLSRASHQVTSPGGLPESGRQSTLHPDHHHTCQLTPSTTSLKNRS